MSSDFQFARRNRARLFAIAAAGCALLLSAVCRGVLPQNAAPRAPIDLQKLIQDAAWNQIQSMQNHARDYQCEHEEITDGNSVTTLEIDTRRGTVERTTQINGHPPSKKQCRRGLAHLNRIAYSPRLQRSRLKDQQSELGRREQLFRALPEAFLFTGEGVEKGTGLLKVAYRPNPDFHPSNRVGAVLGGLAGVMWIDPSSRHIVKIDGRVVKPVTFGWGFLAKLFPGGRYEMEQMRLPDGDWKLAKLDVHLHGTMLIVKKLNVNLTEIYRSYRAVGHNLTLPAAVQMLSRARVDCGG